MYKLSKAEFVLRERLETKTRYFAPNTFLKSILFLGRSLDIPFNETSEEVKKTVQGRSVDVNPNGDVFQAESGCFTEKFSLLV